jgi:hypothetical protein
MEENATGIVHGNTIVLDSTPSAFDGQAVEVRIRRVEPKRPWGEGIRKSAGALADYPELDEIMERIHRERKLDRATPIEP